MASVNKRPDGRWRARYRDASGKEHAKHFARKTDATAWVTEQQAAVQRGTHVDPRAGRETVKAYGERWRAAQVHHRPATVRHVEAATRLHIYPTLGDRRIAAVARSDVQALVLAWSATMAPASVHARYKYLRALFTAAVQDGVIGRSPCYRIKLPEMVAPKVVPLTVVQVRALVAASAEPFRSAMLLGAGCGLRVSEALGLAPDAVRYLQRDVAVRKQLSLGTPWRLVPLKTKNSAREVPAPAFVLDALSSAPVSDIGTLFARDDGRPNTTLLLAAELRAAVVAVNEAAAERSRDRKAGRTAAPELPTVPADTSFHDLRHHYASTLIDGGESVTVVAARLGNDPAETLRTYSHLFPDSADRTRRIIDVAWSEVAVPASRDGRADQLRTVDAGQALDLGLSGQNG